MNQTEITMSLREQAKRNYTSLRRKLARGGEVSTDALAVSAYNLLRETYTQAEALYEDTIVKCVGWVGLQSMRTERLIEGCGMIDGRKLYAM